MGYEKFSEIPILIPGTIPREFEIQLCIFLDPGEQNFFKISFKLINFSGMGMRFFKIVEFVGMGMKLRGNEEVWPAGYYNF